MKSTIIRSLLFVCGALALAAGRASAQQIYVKLDGMQGEAKAKGYEGAIAANGVQIGVTSSAGADARTGTTASRAQFSDLVFVKNVDSASPHLLVNCAAGKRFKSATVSFVATRGDAPVEFLTYRLTDVAVTSVSASGSENSVPTEQISLSFARIEIEYRPIDASGKAGTPIRTGWDVTQNKTASAAFSGEPIASAEGVSWRDASIMMRAAAWIDLAAVACCSSIAIRPVG